MSVVTYIELCASPETFGMISAKTRRTVLIPVFGIRRESFVTVACVLCLSRSALLFRRMRTVFMRRQTYVCLLREFTRSVYALFKNRRVRVKCTRGAMRAYIHMRFRRSVSVASFTRRQRQFRRGGFFSETARGREL